MLVTDVLQRALWWMFFVLLSAMSLSRLTRVADAQTPVAKRPLRASTKADVADGIRFIPWLGTNIQSYLASDLEIFSLRYLSLATFISVFLPTWRSIHHNTSYWWHWDSGARGVRNNSRAAPNIIDTWHQVEFCKITNRNLECCETF